MFKSFQSGTAETLLRFYHTLTGTEPVLDAMLR